MTVNRTKHKGGIVILSLAFAGLICSCKTNESEKEASTSATAAPISSEKFQSLDDDSDGKLSSVEITSAAHDSVLGTLDEDGNGKISANEWNSVTHDFPQPVERFNHIDKDDDGHIDQSEAVEFVTDHVHYSSSYGLVDGDGDKMIGEDELRENDPAILSMTILSIPWPHTAGS